MQQLDLGTDDASLSQTGLFGPDSAFSAPLHAQVAMFEGKFAILSMERRHLVVATNKSRLAAVVTRDGIESVVFHIYGLTPDYP
jgi:hypothetical protein